MLPPYNCPVDFAICEFHGTRMHPRLSVDTIKELHNSGLSTDEDGETVTDVQDSEIPFGFHETNEEDTGWFFPENEL